MVSSHIERLIYSIQEFVVFISSESASSVNREIGGVLEICLRNFGKCSCFEGKDSP